MRLHRPIDQRNIVRITQRFNPPTHYGVDYSCVVGTPLYAPTRGCVYANEQSGGFGRYIRLETGTHYVYLAHLRDFALGGGQMVDAGELIGWSGNTGNSTGPHLHFEVRLANRIQESATDPEPLIDWDWEGRDEQRERMHMPQMWLQTQGHGYDDWLVDHARQVGGVILINPEHGDWRKFVRAGVQHVTGRKVWPNDADKAWIQQGARGAELWFADFWLTARLMPEITIWRGPNEPAIWNADDARTLDTFTSRLADLFHDNGRKLTGLNFSTGHPSFELWRYFGESLSKLDYLGRHSYTCESPWFDRAQWWHPWRLESDMQAIRQAGLCVPPIILGETGIDRAGNKDTDGWRARGVSADEYARLMAHYIIDLGRAIPELYAAAPFVWLSTGWPSFHIDRGDSERLLTHWWEAGGVPVTPDVPPPPSENLGDWIQQFVVPFNRDTAIAKSAAARNMGLLPASDEKTKDGYVEQAWRSAQDDSIQHIARVKVGDWGNVVWGTRKN